ncbi:L-threonylcarbamoyladenylate synthase [Halomicroarcula sp. GCM10025709]|uniref:L-threonylcarbamoyladenylate synthase n=1 Tax=Haloarcula TaxID=2237 RepID=UPI0024C2913A|nr:L-threonylcarbamoyladenylate synthase [Halomicroarcula sp. YJ-61-S]
MTTEVLDPTTAAVETVADCLADGGVVVAPSDTNMALTVDPGHAAAIERVYEIKDRPAHKPLTLFVRDPDDWRRFGTHPDPAVVDTLVEAFWPGPLNLVLEQADTGQHDRLSMDGTVSVGCLSNPVWRDLAAAVDGPLAMTSANQSGTVDDDTLVTVDRAVEHVGDAADYVLAGEPQGTTRASAILSLAAGDRGDATPLRRGDIDAEAIESAAPLRVD